MELFTDNPIETVKDDTFGVAYYVHILRDTIVLTRPLPFCIGIYGVWGAGKSSFMKMLEALLKTPTEVDGVKTAWFNPWKYDTKEELWHAFIQSIIFEMQDSKNFPPEMKEKAKELAMSITLLALRKAITALSVGVITDEDQKSIIEIFGDKENLYYQHINKFEDDFASLVKAYVGKTKEGKDGRLIIFIDDLDRCLPENAITILESLKLFFSHSQCVFVLGMNHAIVEVGIRQRYEKLQMKGHDYLDKIIQLPFYLPPISFNVLKKSLEAEVKRPFLSPTVWKIIEFGMEANPRKTKRFVNCYSLLQSFLDGRNLQIDPLRMSVTNTRVREIQNIYLAMLLVIQMNFPNYYYYLSYNPGDWAFLEQKVLKAANTRDAQDALLLKGELKGIWDEDRDLQRFMEKTSGGGYPEAPSAQNVLNLFQVTNLVTETPAI